MIDSENMHIKFPLDGTTGDNNNKPKSKLTTLLRNFKK